jgi:hypothetical protein
VRWRRTGAFSATEYAKDTSTRCEYASEYYYSEVNGLFSLRRSVMQEQALVEFSEFKLYC